MNYSCLEEQEAYEAQQLTEKEGELLELEGCGTEHETEALKRDEMLERVKKEIHHIYLNYTHGAEWKLAQILSINIGKHTLKEIIELYDGVDILGFLNKVKIQVGIDQEKMRKNGFVIDNLDDRWQKLAFTLYTDLAVLSTEAEQILEQITGFRRVEPLR